MSFVFLFCLGEMGDKGQKGSVGRHGKIGPIGSKGMLCFSICVSDETPVIVYIWEKFSGLKNVFNKFQVYHNRNFLTL